MAQKIMKVSRHVDLLSIRAYVYAKIYMPKQRNEQYMVGQGAGRPYLRLATSIGVSPFLTVFWIVVPASAN